MSATSDEIFEKLNDWKFRLDHFYILLGENNNDGDPIVHFKLRDAQKELLDSWHNRCIVSKCRKIGYSSLLMMVCLDKLIFNNNFKASVIDFKEVSAYDKLEMVRFAWHNSDKFFERHEKEKPEYTVLKQIWIKIKEKVQLESESKSSLTFSNGSVMTASTNTVGSSPNLLIISELGPLAAQQPDRALKIKRGSLNSVAPDSTLIIESTAEGATGVYFDLLQVALNNAGKDKLEKTEYKLIFKPWFQHPSYVLHNKKESDLDSDTIEYFESLEKNYNIKLTIEQKAWYQSKKKEIGTDIYSQFPSTFEESIKTSTTNAIYPEMTNFKSKGKIRSINFEHNYDSFTVWDLGTRDATAGILFQVCGRELLLHRFYSSTGKGANDVVHQIRKWEREYGINISKNIFPHDANRREVASAKTYYDYLKDSGLKSNEIVILERTDNVWNGIRNARNMFNNMWMSTKMNETFYGSDGESLPSLVQCIENYKRNKTGDSPLHDVYSNGADSFRYIAEAMSAGIVKSTVGGVDKKRNFNRPTTQKSEFVGF